ncbi:hypothetical protein CEXT_73911 [Caerostris extrusa]|uniref:Uncharacterized protein n=1 Tax=Caerostris extrusa TaxID=172846 RepID=A0AAV4P8F7_CAEEX|nr:hypothetical protein CEXT_73911 [Caerostris extrusa]
MRGQTQRIKFRGRRNFWKMENNLYPRPPSRGYYYFFTRQGKLRVTNHNGRGQSSNVGHCSPRSSPLSLPSHFLMIIPKSMNSKNGGKNAPNFRLRLSFTHKNQ